MKQKIQTFVIVLLSLFGLAHLFDVALLPSVNDFSFYVGLGMSLLFALLLYKWEHRSKFNMIEDSRVRVQSMVSSVFWLAIVDLVVYLLVASLLSPMQEVLTVVGFLAGALASLLLYLGIIVLFDRFNADRSNTNVVMYDGLTRYDLVVLLMVLIYNASMAFSAVKFIVTSPLPLTTWVFIGIVSFIIAIFVKNECNNNKTPLKAYFDKLFTVTITYAVLVFCINTVASNADVVYAVLYLPVFFTVVLATFKYFFERKAQKKNNIEM